MIKINFFYTAMIFLMLGLGACSHEKETFDGPSLVDRFGPFRVVSELEVSQPTVDFAAGETVFFTAGFNKNVEWVLEITGSVSGSVKRIEGFSSTLDASNATWDGGTTELPLFKTEPCNVVLTVPEEIDFLGTTTVETLSRRTYEGLLFSDFEEELGLNAEIRNFESEFNAQTGLQSDFAGEGNSYFRLEGTDGNLPNFFVGLVDLRGELSGSGTIQFPTTVPEELYFNSFMFSDGGAHGLAIVEFLIDGNGDGIYTLDVDTESFRIPADIDLATWEGWKQFNYPMSQTGITQEDLENVVALRLLLISNMNTQPNPPLQVDYGIDYIIFTEGSELVL